VLHRRLALPIARADGEACIEGVARSSGAPPLVSSITRRSCLCWQAHGSLLDPASAEQSGAQDFYVEDESGRALVKTERAALALGHLERGGMLNVLDADIKQVAAQISDKRVAARAAASDARRAIDAELRELRRLATLLCAIRAHARGNLHIGKSLAEQERLIQERSAEAASSVALREMPARYLQSYDAVLCDGDRVRITGVVSREADPDGAAGGYRDRPLSVVISAPEGEEIHIAAEGGAELPEDVEPDSSQPSAIAKPIAVERNWWPICVLLAAAAAVASLARVC
jgi:hypothetical protein